MSSYVPPTSFDEPFTCRHCGVCSTTKALPIVMKEKRHRVRVDKHAVMITGWTEAYWEDLVEIYDPHTLCITKCEHCGGVTLWVNGAAVWPDQAGTPAHKDMPNDVLEVYDEAQKISGLSPRASCALLRCAAERLVCGLNAKGNNFAQKIQSLNLGPTLKSALDAGRLTGNAAVHGAEIDFSEKSEEAQVRVLILSKAINRLIEDLITQPNEFAKLADEMAKIRKH